MDPTKFDDLTKVLATPTSRRAALRRIGGALTGAIAASWPFGQALASNSACAKFCASVFGADTSAAKQCTSDAAHGKGLCYSCGSSTPASSICCTRNASGFCSSYSGAHCPCSSGQLCCGGTCAGCPTGGVCSGTSCVCPSGQSNCGGTCMNTQSDPKNCGSCGHICASGETCVSGACTCGSHGDCPSGQSCCSGMCVNEQTDTQNCGACGHACSAGQGCCSGTCTDLTTTSNCGSCGHTCASGQTCQDGQCITPCTGGGSCSGDSDCCSGTCCQGTCCSPGRVCLSNGTCAVSCTAHGTCSCGFCAQDTSGAFYCYSDGRLVGTCSDDSGCQKGYFCYYFDACIATC